MISKTYGYSAFSIQIKGHVGDCQQEAQDIVCDVKWYKTTSQFKQWINKVFNFFLGVPERCTTMWFTYSTRLGVILNFLK